VLVSTRGTSRRSSSVRPAAKTPPLPNGWASYVDPVSTHTYYHLAAENTTSWLHPVTGQPHTPVGTVKTDLTREFSASSVDSDIETTPTNKFICTCPTAYLGSHKFTCRASPYFKEPTQKEGLVTRVDVAISRPAKLKLEPTALHYGGKEPFPLAGATVMSVKKDIFSVSHGRKTITFKSKDKTAWISAIQSNIYAASQAEDRTPKTAAAPWSSKPALSSRANTRPRSYSASPRL